MSLPLLLSCWHLHFSRLSPGPGVTQKWEDLCGPGVWARNASSAAASSSCSMPSLQAQGGTMLRAAPYLVVPQDPREEPYDLSLPICRQGEEKAVHSWEISFGFLLLVLIQTKSPQGWTIRAD